VEKFMAEYDPLWAIRPKKRIRRYAKYKNINVPKNKARWW